METSALEPFLRQLEQEDDRAARRLAELLDPGTCHDWLWKINPRDGSRLSEEDFILCLASRLGAALTPAGESCCKLCGEVLDAAASHALCCAKAESTRGHDAVVAAVADGMVLADAGLQTEVRGLVTTGERPADILTTGALPGTKTALDITIAAQDAIHAGLDACRSAYGRKMRNHSHLLPSLRRAGIIFQPMVWSAEGRPHPATIRVMECTLQMVRRRRSLVVSTDLRARWQREIAVAIQRRKAAMMRACLPSSPLRQEWLAQGGAAGEAGDGNMLPPLDPGAGEH